MSEANNSVLNLQELVELAQEARRFGKSVRSDWHSKRVDGERDAQFEEAAKLLKGVIKALEERLKLIDPGGVTEREMQAERGDCFGVLGGLYRDWGKFRDAALAYASGRVTEERIMALGGKANSYCLVQELVNLILDSDGEIHPASELHTKLVAAQTEVHRQILTSRTGDPWAQADLALLTQLIDPMGAALQWDCFEDLNPPRFAYAATKEVVVALFDKLGASMEINERAEWQEALERLS